jgi:hypothetical protein
MKDLDGELRHALRREEPPAGFAERVMRKTIRLTASAKATAVKKPDPTNITAPTPKLSFVHWAAAAALVAAVAGGFDYIAKEKERAEGEAAKDRVVLALQIAGSKLQLVQTKINQLHEQPEKNSNQ